MSVCVVLLAILCASGASAAITYSSDVDLDDGFYSVTIRDAQTFPHYPNYTNNVLTINVSDTVIWLNTHNKDLTTRITLISQQGLWNEKDSYLKWNTRTFSYRFEKPGVYEVYIKENDRFRQTIVVNPIYDSFGNVEIQEPNSAPVQEITDLDPLVKQTPYVVRSYSKRIGRYRPGGYNGPPAGIDLAIFIGVGLLIIYILKISLIKMMIVLRNVLKK